MRLGAAFTRFQTLHLSKGFEDLKDKVFCVLKTTVLPPLPSLCCTNWLSLFLANCHRFLAGAHANSRHLGLSWIVRGRLSGLWQKISGLSR